MTEQEARRAAEHWIAGSEMGGFTARFTEAVRSTSAAHEWRVVFDMFGPEGKREERPMVIMVNEKTQAACPIPSEM
jgi:hypothetical protein